MACMHVDGESSSTISEYEALCFAVTDNYSVKVGLRSEPVQKARVVTAIGQELEQLFVKYKAMVPVYRGDVSESEFGKMVNVFMFLKDKLDTEGNLIKVKARAVVDGSPQKSRIALYGDIDASTPSTTSLMTFVSIVGGEKRHMMQGDVTAAFLHIGLELDTDGDRLHAIFRGELAQALVELYPEYKKFMSSRGNIIVRLDKSCYGLVQSPKNWQKSIGATLQEHGLVANPYEPNWYNMMIDGVQLSVIVWVDDLFFSCKVKEHMLALIEVIGAKYGVPLTIQQGSVIENVGLRFESVENTVLVSSEGYVKALTEGIRGKAATPARDNLFDTRDGVASKLAPHTAELYHSTVAKLLYISRRTYPEIQLAVSFLTTRVQAPDEDDAGKLLRVLQYMNGCDAKEHVLVLTFDPHNPQVYAYIDASFAPHAHAKSQTGGVIFLACEGGGVYSTSEKQNIVTKSSTEAELVGLSNVATQVVYIMNLLKAQGYTMPPAIIYQDNMSTMAMIANGSATAKLTRHINIRYFWVKDNVERGEVCIQYMPTEDMVADVLTKPLQGHLFRRLAQRLRTSEEVSSPEEA